MLINISEFVLEIKRTICYSNVKGKQQFKQKKIAEENA